MKKIFFIALMIMVGMVAESYAQSAEEKPLASAGKQTIDVYYFHATRRCATCNAVEDQSQLALKNLYAQQLESGDIQFHSVNFEEADGKALADKFKVPGQALIVVKGESKTDLTSDGFMYARSAPAKLENSLKKAIDPLL
ncbi:MAG: nitrophenyl compound nitroreductase subunit ArsF family protein [Bacteroidales bacterium]|jgi:hypothetical protein